jgi:DNA-binding CsgD family transcriptional regulator
VVAARLSCRNHLSAVGAFTASDGGRKCTNGGKVVTVGAAAAARRVRGQAAGSVSFVHGKLRTAKIAYELQKGARESVQRIGVGPAALAAEFDSVERDLLCAGVRLRTLHDPGSLSRPDQVERTRALAGLGGQARVVAGSPLRMLLVDASAALLPLTADDGAVRLAVLATGGPLPAVLDQIFQELWRTAMPFADLAAGVAGPQPTEQEYSILSLLAAGATDDGIARRLGVSGRTAHRRVRELMARLDVQTRFQAGVKAVRLGWL